MTGRETPLRLKISDELPGFISEVSSLYQDISALMNEIIVSPTHSKAKEEKSPDVVGGKVKKPGKHGGRPAKIDLKAKLERSQQSTREYCRAREKLQYQYLEESVSSRERAICGLRELEMYKQWCMAMDQRKTPSEIKALLPGEEQNSSRHRDTVKTEANNNSW
ncbi:cAMP-responsive element-binding protein-like 2 [Notamacropus eugenii]|uniref:cAMP-responsive element-binding protein-like 2 n=1 Tax=Notamacropus eugenii TaxID=9315 RepID=UPI003B675E4F